MKFQKILLTLIALLGFGLLFSIYGYGQGAIRGQTVGAGAVSGSSIAPGSGFGSVGMRNRIVNGDIRIDQLNGGAVSAAAGTTFGPDKWRSANSGGGGASIQQLAATPPAGFSNYLRLTVTTADAAPAAGSFYFLLHIIEGTYCQDLQFGLATSQSVTLSFWVRTTLSGTFSGALANSPGNRSYAFPFSIPAANTWTYVTVTIPVDQTGSWLTTNAIGVQLRIDLGSGANFKSAGNAWAAANLTGTTGAVGLYATNGATFDLTGVQLEPGTTATSYEQVALTDEIQRCQREYCKSFLLATAPVQNAAVNTGETLISSSVGAASALGLIHVQLPVIMRVAPAVTTFNPAAASGQVRDETGSVDCSAAANVNITERQFSVSFTTNAATAQGNKLGVHWVADSRL